MDPACAAPAARASSSPCRCVLAFKAPAAPTLVDQLPLSTACPAICPASSSLLQPSTSSRTSPSARSHVTIDPLAVEGRKSFILPPTPVDPWQGDWPATEDDGDSRPLQLSRGPGGRRLAPSNPRKRWTAEWPFKLPFTAGSLLMSEEIDEESRKAAAPPRAVEAEQLVRSIAFLAARCPALRVLGVHLIDVWHHREKGDPVDSGPTALSTPTPSQASRPTSESHGFVHNTARKQDAISYASRSLPNRHDSDSYDGSNTDPRAATTCPLERALGSRSRALHASWRRDIAYPPLLHHHTTRYVRQPILPTTLASASCRKARTCAPCSRALATAPCPSASTRSV